MNAEQLKDRYAKFWTLYRSTAEAVGLPRDKHRADWNGDRLYVDARANIDRFALVVRNNRWWVEYEVSTPDRELTIPRFRHTFDNRDAIQRAFGNELEWTMKENRKSGTVRSAAYNSGILTGESDWAGMQARMQLAMKGLIDAIEPYRDPA